MTNFILKKFKHVQFQQKPYQNCQSYRIDNANKLGKMMNNVPDSSLVRHKETGGRRKWDKGDVPSDASIGQVVECWETISEEEWRFEGRAGCDPEC